MFASCGADGELTVERVFDLDWTDDLMTADVQVFDAGELYCSQTVEITATR